MNQEAIIWAIIVLLVIAGIVVRNIANSEPMPKDMEEEDERLKGQQQRVEIDLRLREVRANFGNRSLGERLQDTGGAL